MGNNPMEQTNTQAVGVNPGKNTQVVFAIPAKPKPKKPWYKDAWGGWFVIWLCMMTALYIWVNP